jgi:hypothetical protein
MFINGREPVLHEYAMCVLFDLALASSHHEQNREQQRQTQLYNLMKIHSSLCTLLFVWSDVLTVTALSGTKISNS